MPFFDIFSTPLTTLLIDEQIRRTDIDDIDKQISVEELDQNEIVCICISMSVFPILGTIFAQ